MKTLIINGSPRVNGNTVALINELKKHLRGEVIELSAFRSGIAPCVDCRGCWKTARCVVRDEMDTIYADDFDNVVIASPVYFMTLPGQVLNVLSRMQPWHVAMFFLKQPLVQRKKKAAVILTGGGKGNADGARHHLRAFFRMLNADGWQEHMAASLMTDTVPALEDAKALEDVARIAAWLNENEANQ
ncbi:MAG: flavodoxin family protein [Clostridia bacterium]|nr:flavodoxin family protein [Clostridia bacterium]